MDCVLCFGISPMTEAHALARRKALPNETSTLLKAPEGPKLVAPPGTARYVAVMAYEISRLRATDADVLGPLHNRIWRECYAGLVPRKILDARDDNENTSIWLERGRAHNEDESSPDGFTTFVARDDVAPAPVEVWALVRRTRASGERSRSPTHRRVASCWAGVPVGLGGKRPSHRVLPQGGVHAGRRNEGLLQDGCGGASYGAPLIAHCTSALPIGPERDATLVQPYAAASLRCDSA